MDVVRTRCAVREYTEDPVDDDTVESMLSALLSAPSGGNAQAWAFVLVRAPARIRQLRAFAPGVVGKPTVLLVACFDAQRDEAHAIGQHAGPLCVSMAVENFLLAAHAHGLGACPTSSFRGEQVRLLLELPPHLDPVLMVAAGHPSRPPQRSERRAKEEVISYEIHGLRAAPTAV
ncbi:nitroreductase family protein [Streptomyces iconiensis]|uniref:Nitroreductase family protein n=1 Tax=Streptomyces iconiensis TaxID=1384038 RepID=A0ABT7A2C7_9ACTN|nr:nitroreductase family protein [Streptomyces iconiensis]MDJ1135475.1 nitroreductase family protein [Streptomyces iconiensis]